MELTIKQTDKILEILNGYGLQIIDMAQEHGEQFDLFNIQVIGEEYFNEKVNEALKEN